MNTLFFSSAFSQNNLMPNGEANVTGNVFEILHADRHSAGHYRCSADNRVGAADTREIFVNVLCKKIIFVVIVMMRICHFPFRPAVAPEIEVERAFIHTGVGYEAQLTCLVHSEPPANIVWYKDTTQLGTTEQHSLQVKSKYLMVLF